MLWTPAFWCLLEFKINDYSYQNHRLIKLSCGEKSVELHVYSVVSPESDVKLSVGWLVVLDLTAL